MLRKILKLAAVIKEWNQEVIFTGKKIEFMD